MAVTDFTYPQKEAITGLDNVVIQKFIAGIAGGRTLDCSAWAADVVKAGTVVITDGNGAYKPMPYHAGSPAKEAVYAKTTDTALVNSKTYYTFSDGVYTEVSSPVVGDISSYFELVSPAVEEVEAGYESLPQGWKYAGVVACTIPAARPAASVMTAGVVNAEAAPCKFNPIKEALKAALPTLEFTKEEYA